CKRFRRLRRNRIPKGVAMTDATETNSTPADNLTAPRSDHKTDDDRTRISEHPAVSEAKEIDTLDSARKAAADGKVDDPAGPVAIAKPGAFDLNKFKSKRADAIANVDTLQTGLPISSMSQAKDFVRLHPKEDLYWSPELCFVMVPIKG